MSEPVFLFDGEDPAMLGAYKAAQQSFKYFWREMSWERRRIIPGLDMSMVKLLFSDGPRTDGKPEYEHMWVGEVDFDGEVLSGQLLNSPNWLSSVKKGDSVRVPFSRLTDWMMTTDGRAYGGLTVNLMRAKMGNHERKQHDDAWGLEFGDPTTTRLEIKREETPKKGFFAGLFANRSNSGNQQDGFRDHPMCVNMLEKIEAQLKVDSAVANTSDNDGWSLLHKEALAGNFGVVRLLVDYGANVNLRTESGRTASELATMVGWAEIAEYLDEKSAG